MFIPSTFFQTEELLTLTYLALIFILLQIQGHAQMINCKRLINLRPYATCQSAT
jgi:hypothetical protein